MDYIVILSKFQDSFNLRVRLRRVNNQNKNKSFLLNLKHIFPTGKYCCTKYKMFFKDKAKFVFTTHDIQTNTSLYPTPHNTHDNKAGFDYDTLRNDYTDFCLIYS